MAENSTHAVDLMQEIVKGARNDEILEVGMFLFELLGERAESSLDLAIESNDRDALNEAFVFASRAHALVPSLTRAKRVDDAWWCLRRAKDRAAEAVQLDREESGGPAPAPSRRARSQSEIAAERRAFESVDLSAGRVLEALRAATGEGEAVPVSAVARLLVEGTKVKAGSTAWRRVIARATVVLRRAAAEGAVRQHRPADSQAGRVTCRWEVADA